jgi:hypothetical protein
MSIDNVTTNRGYELPNKDNSPAYDVDRIVAALTAADVDVAALFALTALKAAINSPAFSGSPTAPTQPAAANDNTLATTGHVKSALSAFLNDAEGAIATITELEAALSGEGVVADLMALIALKAPLASPALTGTPTAPTASTATDTTQLATTAFVQAIRAAIVSTAPTSLDTLAKMATAIGNDPNFVATITSVLGGKASLDSPAFTGTPTVPNQAAGNNTTRAANTAFVKAAIDIALSTVSTNLASAVAGLVPKTRTVSAGAGLSGGGALDANRTVSLGAAKPITNSTTGTVAADGHDHALGFVASEVYTGSTRDQTSFPLGHIVQVQGTSTRSRNAAFTVYLSSTNTDMYFDSSGGAALSGTWRARGAYTISGNKFTLAQRVA